MTTTRQHIKPQASTTPTDSETRAALLIIKTYLTYSGMTARDFITASGMAAVADGRLPQPDGWLDHLESLAHTY